MPSDRVTVLIQNVAVRIGLSSPAPDKPRIVSVRNKADVLTVPFFGVDQFVRLRKLPCFTLVKRTEGKAKIAELLLRQHVQDIALVLLFIDSLKKLPAPQIFTVGCARVMPGGQNVISCLFCRLQQGVKFQVTVAVDAGVRSPACLIFLYESADNRLLKAFGKAHGFMRDPKLPADKGSVLLIRIAAAAFLAACLVAALPVQTHRDACAVVSRILHQQGCDGAVHAAAHGNHGAHIFFLFLMTY